MDLFDEPPPGNAPEFSVSDLTGAVKRAIEGEFGHVRVRGEVGRVVQARTGHLYFDLKDDRNVLASVSWKGQVSRLSHRPEEGMEVIATGRLTTYGPQSKYQLNVEDVTPAGAGALMAMLEKRRRALEAEGLFDASRKRPLPYLPEVIGVVTSPTGAVIRDILHRLRDRFPRRVLVWPVAVQGKGSAEQVAAAIRGFNALTPGGALPRPDLLIVARGGGSIEDLWGFNEEIVVRAAADSAIPLISAVGHETDTTLIDHAADRRAPTPTAAAELAVPVRLDLSAALETLGARLTRAAEQGVGQRRQRLGDLARVLPRPEALVAPARQRLDIAERGLDQGLTGMVRAKRLRLADQALRPAMLRTLVREKRDAFARTDLRLAGALRHRAAEARARLDRATARLTRGRALDRILRARERLAGQATRLHPDLVAARIARARERLEAADRMRQSLGYVETLRRGYAVVRADAAVVTTAAAARIHDRLQIEFADDRVQVRRDEAQGRLL